MVAWGGCLFHGSRSAHFFCFLLPSMVSSFDRHALELSLCPWCLTSAWRLKGHFGPIRAARLQSPRPFTPVGTWPPSPAHRASSRAACQVHPLHVAPASNKTTLVDSCASQHPPHACHTVPMTENGSATIFIQGDMKKKKGRDHGRTIYACNPNMQRPAPLTRSSTRPPAWRSRSGWHLRPRA